MASEQARLLRLAREREREAALEEERRAVVRVGTRDHQIEPATSSNACRSPFSIFKRSGT